MNDLLLQARCFVNYLLPLQINSIHALIYNYVGQQELKKMAINDHFLAINDHDMDPHVENR